MRLFLLVVMATVKEQIKAKRWARQHVKPNKDVERVPKHIRDSTIITLVKERRYRSKVDLFNDYLALGEEYGVSVETFYKYLKDLGVMKDVDGYLIYSGKSMGSDGVEIPDRDAGREIARSDLYYCNISPRLEGDKIIFQGFYTGHFLKRGFSTWRPKQMISVISDENTTIIFCASENDAKELHKEVALMTAVGQGFWNPSRRGEI